MIQICCVVCTLKLNTEYKKQNDSRAMHSIYVDSKNIFLMCVEHQMPESEKTKLYMRIYFFKKCYLLANVQLLRYRV